MKCVSPLSIKDPAGTTGAVRFVVDCGRCGSCLHNRRVDWSFRLKEELRAAISAWFVTLTYAPENLPINNDVQTLNKRDVQLFIKRVRKDHQKKNSRLLRSLKMPPIRYYAVGEYGTNTDRPHYHLLIFNMHLETASRLDAFWPLGQIQMGTVQDAGIHYVTKYHVNYKSKQDIVDELTGEVVPMSDVRQAEFALMSKGIGRSYMDRIGTWHKDNKAAYVMNNGFKQRMPRYYRKNMRADQLHVMTEEERHAYIDDKYFAEVERLAQFTTNPDSYLENALYQESLRIWKDAKNGLSL